MITQFTPDILESIFGLLDFDSLVCLWFSGSRSLQLRIGASYQRITKHRSDLASISSLLHILPSLHGLKSLLINVNNPKIEDSELKNLATYLHTGLKHLELEFHDSLKWLTFDSQAGKIRSSAELHAILPNLETLKVILESEIWGLEQIEALTLLPLLSLQLLNSPLPLSVIGMLPSSLTLLEIYIQESATEEEWTALKFPESLVALTIDKPNESLLIPRLPRGLTALSILHSHPDTTFWDEQTSVAMCEQLPPSLVNLSWCFFGYPTRSSCNFTLESVSKLPRGIKYFSTRTSIFPAEAMKGLPPNIESCMINCAPMDPPFYTSSWPRSLTYVDLSCIPPEEWNGLPPNIYSVPLILRNDLEAPVSCAYKLPARIKFLDIYPNVNHEFLEKAGCTQTSSISLRAMFDERQLAALTRFSAVKTLSITISNLKLLSDLSPAKLHTIFISMKGTTDLADLDLTRPWASQLSQITITKETNDSIGVDDAWVQNLPRSLNKISIKFLNISRDALRFLPPQLDSMQLSCSQLSLITDIGLLPRALSEIRFFRSAPEISGTVRQLITALPIRVNALGFKGTKLVFSDLPANDAWELFRPLALARPSLDTLELPGTHPKTGGGTIRFKIVLQELLPPLKSQLELQDEEDVEK